METQKLKHSEQREQPTPTVRKKQMDEEEALLLNYFKEIGQVSLISKEREKELGKRIKDGDEQALEELVNANLRFVVKIAKRYMNHGIPLQDLISEGNIGLIQAAKKFDYTRGNSFTTYAVWYIRQAIAKAVTQFNCIVNIPKKQQVMLRKLESIMQDMEEKSFDDAVEEMELDPIQYSQIYNLKNGLVPLDGTYQTQTNEETKFSDILRDARQPSPEDEYMDASLHTLIEDLLEHLDERERQIIILKFGLDGNNPHTLKEIATIMDFSRERVRQIKIRALEKLRRLSKTCTLRAFLN